LSTSAKSSLSVSGDVSASSFAITAEPKQTQNGKECEMKFEEQVNQGKIEQDQRIEDDGTEVLEVGPFGVESLRWTKSSGRRAARRTAFNRRGEDYEPIVMLFGVDPFEVKPNQLYLELEQLSLDDASDEVLRAYVGFRTQVIDDLIVAAWDDIHEAAQDD